MAVGRMISGNQTRARCHRWDLNRRCHHSLGLGSCIEIGVEVPCREMYDSETIIMRCFGLRVAYFMATAFRIHEQIMHVYNRIAFDSQNIKYRKFGAYGTYCVHFISQSSDMKNRRCSSSIQTPNRTPLSKSEWNF
jgi:hypothetical protein